MGNNGDQPKPPLTEEQRRAIERGELLLDIPLTTEQRRWLDSNKPDGGWTRESARRVIHQLWDTPDWWGKRAAAEERTRQLLTPSIRKWLDSWPEARRALAADLRDLAEEVAAKVLKALRQPRRKRAPRPTTKTARARELAEQLYPNGVGAVGEKNQKAIRSTFCDAYRERYGEGLSDSQAWRTLFGPRG
jgi:hypothetical protein